MAERKGKDLAVYANLLDVSDSNFVWGLTLTEDLVEFRTKKSGKERGMDRVVDTKDVLYSCPESNLLSGTTTSVRGNEIRTLNLSENTSKWRDSFNLDGHRRPNRHVGSTVLII